MGLPTSEKSLGQEMLSKHTSVEKDNGPLKFSMSCLVIYKNVSIQSSRYITGILIHI